MDPSGESKTVVGTGFPVSGRRPAAYSWPQHADFLLSPVCANRRRFSGRIPVSSGKRKPEGIRMPQRPAGHPTVRVRPRWLHVFRSNGFHSDQDHETLSCCSAARGRLQRLSVRSSRTETAPSVATELHGRSGTFRRQLSVCRRSVRRGGADRRTSRRCEIGRDVG